MLYAIVGILAVIVLAVVTFLVVGGDDEEEPEVAAPAEEVILVAVTDEGADPWTGNLDVGNPDLQRVDVVLEDVPIVNEDERGAFGLAIAGDEPGLYGGVRDEIACDRDALAGGLGDDAAMASAFTEVLAIDDDDIDGFLGGLTAVMLRQDMRLADHDFVDEQARRFEAVLERGTAVLVDSDGVPRVRCASGSPLAAARATGTTETYGGAPWPSFDPEGIVTVVPTGVGGGFVLIDNDTEDIFLRFVGSVGDNDQAVPVDLACLLNPNSVSCQAAEPTSVPDDSTTTTEPELGTGDVQFTLRWNSTADLDLAVTDPTGARINFSQKVSPSGGVLDVDANANCREQNPPVENIYWPPGTAPSGTYTIEIKLYNDCENGPQEFSLNALIGGQDATETGTVSDGDDTRTFTFTF